MAVYGFELVMVAALLWPTPDFSRHRSLRVQYWIAEFLWISYGFVFSPGAGEQYGRPSSGGGGAGGGGGNSGGGGNGAGEEAGASNDYRRIFTEEQYRMLAQVRLLIVLSFHSFLQLCCIAGGGVQKAKPGGAVSQVQLHIIIFHWRTIQKICHWRTLQVIDSFRCITLSLYVSMLLWKAWTWVSMQYSKLKFRSLLGNLRLRNSIVD